MGVANYIYIYIYIYTHILIYLYTCTLYKIRYTFDNRVELSLKWMAHWICPVLGDLLV